MEFRYEKVKAETLEEYVAFVRDGYRLDFIELKEELKPFLFEYALKIEDEVKTHFVFFKCRKPNALKNLILGECYYTGEYGVDRNYAKAFEYYKKSADSGDARAQAILGYMYYLGDRGIPQNYATAFQWFQKAAEQGDEEAQYTIGFMYYHGDRGVPQNYAKANEWYRKAAEQGDASAQYNLGMMYYNGEGVPQNYAKANEWYRKAAEQGDALAQYNLGIMYYNGEGVSQDYAKALEWFQKAGEQGNALAQYNLGVMYYNGEGVSQDYAKALEWYTKAYDNGKMECRGEIQRLLKLVVQEKDKPYLHVSFSKDIFISWNHEDENLMKMIYTSLESDGIMTCFQSNRDATGDLDSVIAEAIKDSKAYLVLLTEKSVRSPWVKKEIQMMIDSCEKRGIPYCQIIKPVIWMKDGKNPLADVHDEIFDKLNHNSFFFINDVGNIDFKSLTEGMREILTLQMMKSYHDSFKNKFNTIEVALTNTVSSNQSATGIVSSVIEFEKGYLNRPVYKDGHRYDSSVLLSERPVLIHGDGGTGKTLYLKNLINNAERKDVFLLYLPLRMIKEEYKGKELSDVLLIESFKQVFPEHEQALMDQNEFSRELKSLGTFYLLLDAIDEIDPAMVYSVFDMIHAFRIQYPKARFVFTSRNPGDAKRIGEAIDVPDVYELKGITDEDIHSLYDKIVVNYKPQKTDENSLLSNQKSWDSFDYYVKNLSPDIKSNPLLMSNLIFIYLANRNFDTSLISKKYGIISQSVNMMIKDLEEERRIDDDSLTYVKGEKLDGLLGYLSFKRMNGSDEELEKIVLDYLKDIKVEYKDPEDLSRRICKRLVARSIITDGNVSHEIFREYFIANRIYKRIFKLVQDMDFGEDYISFRNDGKDALKKYDSKYFSKEEAALADIASCLVMKTDLEIFKIDKKEMKEGCNLSFDTFKELLCITLKEKGFSSKAIEVVKTLAENDRLFFSYFVKEYCKSEE